MAVIVSVFFSLSTSCDKSGVVPLRFSSLKTSVKMKQLLDNKVKKASRITKYLSNKKFEERSALVHNEVEWNTRG